MQERAAAPFNLAQAEVAPLLSEHVPTTMSRSNAEAMLASCRDMSPKADLPLFRPTRTLATEDSRMSL
eukprot:205423-Amphidinium_carterae.1